MADKPIPTRPLILDIVPLRSTAEAGQDEDLVAAKYGAIDDDEDEPRPVARTSSRSSAPDEDAIAAKYGAYEPPTERRLDERGKVREVDPFGNLVPRAFRSSAPQGPSQKTPGRWSQPKTIDVAPVRQPAFEDTLEGLSRSDIPPAVGDRITDTGVSLLKGAIGIPEAAVGLVDIPAGGRIGKALDEAGFQPGQAKSILERWYSDRLQNQKMEVSEADGVMETAVKALSNPDVVFQAVAESLPVMLAGGVAGRFVPGVSSLATRGAIGEGLMAAGSAEESTRQQSPTGLTTRTQGALAVATGASTTALGRLGGAIATKLGLDDIDTLLAAAEFDPIVKTNLVQAIARATVGAGQEGLLEELPQSVVEQWLANAAQGEPLMKGVDEAAVLGALSGGVMGFAANIQPVRRPGEGDDAAGGDPQRPYGSVLGRLSFPEDGGDTMDVAPAPEPPPPAPVAPEPPPTSLAALGDENAPAPPAPRSRPDSGPRLMYQIDNPMESDTPVAVQVIMRDGRPAAIFDRGQMIDVPQGLSTLPVERIIAQLIGDHPDGAEPRADLVSRIEQDAAPAPDVEALLAEADQLDAEADAKKEQRKAWDALRSPETAREYWGFEPVATENAGETVYAYTSEQNGVSPRGVYDGPLDQWSADMVGMGYSEDEVQTAIKEAERRGIDPTRSDDLHDLGDYMSGLDWARENTDGLPPLRDLDEEPTIEVIDDTATTENASGESAASAEALSRQEGMKARGEKFVVYNRSGKPRDLIGPEAVDYTPKKGETYGVQGPDGFRVLTDNGGKVPSKSRTPTAGLIPSLSPFGPPSSAVEAPPDRTPSNAELIADARERLKNGAVLSEEDAAMLRDLAQEEADANAGAIDTTATNADEMSDEEMAAEIKRRLEAESAPKTGKATRQTLTGYHGSANIARAGKFEGFKLDTAPDGRTREIGETIDSMGTWFTASKNDAALYGRSIGDDGVTGKPGAVVEATVTLDNPRVFESPEAFFRDFLGTFPREERAPGMKKPVRGELVRKQLMDEGYDGVIIRNGGKGDGTPDGADTFLSFDNRGVKAGSATMPEATAAPKKGKRPPFEKKATGRDEAAIAAKRAELKGKIAPFVGKRNGGLTASEAERFRALMGELRETYYDDKAPNEAAMKTSPVPRPIIEAAFADVRRDKDVWNRVGEASNGVYFDKDTPVDEAVDRVSAQFDATRKAIRAEYGDTVTLYRATTKQKPKATANYVLTKADAEQYGDTIEKRVVPVEDIVAMQVGTGGYHEFVVRAAKPAAPKPATLTASDEAMERIASEDEAERQAEPGWSNTKPTDVQAGGGIAGLFGGSKPKVGKGGWVIMGRTSMGWGPTSSWSAAKVKADGAKQLDALKAATDARAMRIETPDGKLVYETPAWKTRNAGRISATPTARGYVGSYTDGDGTDWYSDEAFPKVDAAFEAARTLAAKRKGPLMHRYTGKRVEYGTEDWNDAANIDKPAKAAPEEDAPPVKAKSGKRPPFEKAPPDGWKAEDKVPQKKKSAAPFGRESMAPTYTEIGKNAIGQTVYEDGNGVRSLVVEGVRMTEPVGMRPTGEGMRTFVERDSDGEPKRAEYRVVKAPAEFKVGDRVTVAGEGTGKIGQIVGETALVTTDAGKMLPWANFTRLTHAKPKKPVTPQVPALSGMTPLGTKADTPAVDSKRAELDAKRAALKDEIAAAAAAVRAELKKAANTTNSGLPVPDGALILQTVKLVRLYAKAGIVEAAIGWDYFKTDIGADLAAQAKRAFQVAWGMVHKVAEPELEDSDGTTDRGDANGGQLSAAGRAAADEPGAAREGALGEVPAEADGRSDGERRVGPVDSEARTPDGVRDRGDGGEDGSIASGDRADVPVAALSPAGIGERDPGHAVGDYQLTPERITSIIERGAMERARDNIKAIQIAQDIRAEQRHATAEEQEALAKYVGWGDTNVAKYLAESVDYRWRETEKAVWRQIQGLTTEAERRALVHSTQNAHYTFDLYRPVWAALERAGFTHGRILEPAVGTGHAFGLMPPGMRQLSTLNAVELEPLTATIAQALYPSARVQASGFEKARLPHGTQDLIISNVPFARGRKSGGAGVRDSRLPDFLTDSIHNYFFAKALTYARPGGLVVFVTTHHTMDAPGAQRVRRHLMSQAHFVGAVRLPNTAFGEGAKTEVVTDIVVLQRKLDDRDEARNADLFIESMKTKNGDRSRWYEEHPELIIGTEDAEGTMYGPGQYNVTAREGDLIEQLAPALEQVLTPGLYEPAKPKEASAPPTLAEAEETARFGEFSIGDKGQVFRVTQDRKLAPADVKGETKKRLVGMIGIRDQLVTTRRLMRASGDTGIKAAQSKLRKLYDAFTAQYGLLNARVNRALFDGDPEAINLLALEELESKASTVTDKNGKETLKITRELKKLADIFTKRTINAPRAEIKADTPKAALLASLAQFTGINWRYMASISGQTEAALQESLSAEGRVFRQPDGSWVTDDEYLSGDVVSKLEDAEAAHDDALAPNIAALKRVQPVPKKPEEMRIALGSHWVPAEFVHRFMADLLMVQASDLPMPRYVGTREVGRWMVDNLPSYGEVARAAAKHPLTVEFGHDNTKTEDKPFGSGHIYTVYDLFSDVLNLKVPYLSWTVRSSDGTSTTYKAPEATLAARGNMEELQAEWEAWLGANPVVLNGLTDAYNERFNRTVERKFDGDHLREYLKDNGLTLPYDLHKHQVDAVWRILATGNTLLAHEVGAGKTLEMIIAAMEMRRTGRARKPMITVPTYLLGQWREAITSAYPDAKVLAFDEKDLDAKKRQQAMARIAFGDWDIVLVPHSSFELLRVSPERMVATLEEMVREIEEAELAAGKGRGRKKKGGSSDDGPDVKALAQMRARIEDKIEKLLKRAAKDNAAKNLHWEDLGVDALLVDEAHAFKNLFYFTNMDNIRGLSKSNSDRAIGMYVKTKDLNDVSGSRNLVFATATPVMNSLAEIFTFQRYLQPKQLDQLGLTNFDNWYRMYGKAVPRVEQRPDGSYQEVLRVAEFRNLDHLSKVTRSVMDYVGWPDMPYLKLPKLHGDRIDIVQTPKHGLYDKYIQPWFELRLAVLKLFPPRYDKQKEEYIAPDRPDPISGKPTGKNDNVLAVMTDARKAAIDIRLVLPSAADSKTSRIQQAADRIFDSYKREAKKKGVQLVFLDWGTPKSPEPLEFLSNVKVEAEVEPDDVDSATPATGEDEDDSEFIGDDDSPVNLYAELRAALVKRGIPSREIAFVHQARNAGERVALFTAAQEGRVRVVVGSTDKGGVGMNIQHRMSDIHELDAPRAMRPGDIRQRHGRGIRQGNVYERIRIHRYVTPGTTDEWQYGLLGAKQDLIEAFMRGTATEFSEPDPTTMSVEEAQARASGDPRAAELIELKGKYGRMKAQAAGALRSVAAAKVDAPRLRSAIASKEKDIQKAELFLSEVYQTQRGDGFRVTVGERTFTERKEATAALASVMDSYVARAEKTGSAGDEVIGTIGGIDIVAQWDVPRSWEYNQKPAAAIRLDASKAGEAELTVVAGISERKAGEDAPFNYALLLVNRYEDLSQTARVLQRELEKLQGELSRAENVLANPPAVIERATKARARIDELESALRTESDARMQAAEEGARKAVDAMKSAIDARRSAAPGLPAPSGDASAGPAVTMVVSPGKAATLPATAADQMGLTTARPVFVPELVAFLTDSGGKTQVLKKLRSLGARGFFRDGTVTLAADLFKPENAIELARVLAHEIGHLVDWLPDGDMKRGNLLGRLRTMHRFLKHRYTSADGTTVKMKEVRDELLALSKAWRPWPDDAGPKYDAYRRRGRELYADAISALLNDPAIVQQKAPTFFKEFFSELDEKPEVKQAYIELMDVLSGTPEELIERRRGRVREMFDYGNTKALDLVALKLAERDAMRYSVMDRIRIQHVDRNTALNDRVADWEKEHGRKVPSHEDPRFLLEEQAHIKGGAKGFAAKYFEPVYRALNKAGVDWTTFGEILFYERIVAGDRSEVANPQGLSAENAKEMLAAAFASLSTEQRSVARAQADAFREALREVADRAYQAGLYTDELYKQMQENPAYVTFRVLEYLDQNVTSTVYRQVGTLKDIQHPAEASIVKAMVTLKAAEYNRIKRGTFEWFDKNTPGEFTTAPTKWMGKQRGWVPQEPKDNKLKLITYKVKGKTVGKHVDPYVAASFERMGADELGVVLGTLNLLTSKWLRPVFTTMNPGFMTFNLKRDFDRGWKNMDAALVAQGKPRMTLRRWLKRYYQAVPMSVARAFPSKPGQSVAAWRQRAEQALIDAEEAKILDLTLADILGADNLEDTNIDQVFADIGLSSYAAQKGRLKRFLGWVEAAGDFIETLPKAAAIIELTSDGRTVKELTADERSLIRRKVGSPDYLQRGTKTAASNTIFLFSNAIIQGTRADVEVATDPTTRGGWWFKTAAVNLAPKVLMFALPMAAAALAGGGGDDEDDWLSFTARVMSGVSEYDKTNYVIVPLGLDENGDSIYARLPQDDTGRLVGGIFWKGLGMMSGDKDAMKSLMQAFDFTAGQLPGSNPLIRAITADLPAMAAGLNIYDPFRSRMLFTPDELAAMDRHTFKKFVGYEFQQLGGGIVWRFVPGEERPATKSTARTLLDLPVVSNVVGRWLRVGNRGRVEGLRELTSDVRQDEARARLNEKELVNKAIRALQAVPPPSRARVTAERASAIIKEVYPALTGDAAADKRKLVEKKVRLGLVRGEADEYVETIMSSTSNAQKVAVVKRAKREMAPPKFSAWLRRGQDEGVISRAVAEAARKER